MVIYFQVALTGFSVLGLIDDSHRLYTLVQYVHSSLHLQRELATLADAVCDGRDQPEHRAQMLAT